MLPSNTTFGGSVGAFSRFLGFEVGLDYTSIASFNIGPVTGSASLTNLMGNVVAQVPLGRFAPYGTFGYGALVARGNAAPVSGDFLVAFQALNFGFGAKVFVNEHVGVRADYRRFGIQIPRDATPANLPIAIGSSPGLDRLTVGGSFKF